MSALYAAGVGPGDEVITPTLGYIGSYTGVIHLGAKPVFCDVDPGNGLIDPADAEKHITKRTRAILPVHFQGNVCDMDGLLALREKYGVAIVHDAAHAHPSGWDGVKLGAWPDVSATACRARIPLASRSAAAKEGSSPPTTARSMREC